MAEIKLSKQEERYYSKLFQEDKNYYTVVDSIRQLPMFADRFREDEEILAFIEFISNIFHICWQADVFDNNHLRLMDILFGFQYAIEFQHDREAEEIVEKLIRRFYEIYDEGEKRIHRRVFTACKDIVSRHSRSIPAKEKLKQDAEFFLTCSREYVLQYPDAVSRGELPKWSVRDRSGLTKRPLDNAVIRIQTNKRRKVLENFLQKQH